MAGLIRHAYQRIKVDGTRLLSETAFRVREQLEDQTTSVAEFTIADKTGQGKYARGKEVKVEHIRLQDSQGGKHDMRRIFTGIVDKVDGTSYPNEVAVTATGQLARLRLTFDDDDNLSGMSDRDAARHILSQCGIAYSSGDVEGSSYNLGQRQDVVWTAGQSGAEMLSELDRVFGYATIENGDGRVARIKYSRVPKDYHDNNIAERRTFRRGDERVTFYDNQRTRGDIASVVNHWVVNGLEYTVDENKDADADGLTDDGKQGCSRRIWAEASSPNHKLLGNGTEITSEFSSDLIQSPGLAKQIAKRLMRWYNRETDTIRIECGEDSRITVGTLIAVKDDAFGVDLDRTTPYVVTDIQREGDFMTIDAIGGDPGDEGSIHGGIEECCGSWESDGTCTPNEKDDTEEPPLPEPIPIDPPPVDDLECDPILDPTCHPPVDGGDETTGPGTHDRDFEDDDLGTTPNPPPPIDDSVPPITDGCTPFDLSGPGVSFLRPGVSDIDPNASWQQVLFEDGSLSHISAIKSTSVGWFNLQPVDPFDKTDDGDMHFPANIRLLVEGEFRFRRASAACSFSIGTRDWDGADATSASAQVYESGHSVVTAVGAVLETEESVVGAIPSSADDLHTTCPPTPTPILIKNGTWNFYGKTYPATETPADFGDGWHKFSVYVDEGEAPQRTYLFIDDYTEYVENRNWASNSATCIDNADQSMCETRHPDGHRVFITAQCSPYNDPDDSGSGNYPYDLDHPLIDVRNLSIAGTALESEGLPEGALDDECVPSDDYEPGPHTPPADILPFEQQLCFADATVTQLPGGSFSHSDCDCYDFGIPTGTPIYPVAPGTVAAADDSDPSGTYGYFIDVDTDYGTIRYAHLSALMVTAGQDVDMDTRLGTSGATGTIFGSPVSPHLHLQLNGAPALGGGLDDAMTAEGILLPESRRAQDAEITCTAAEDDLG